MKREQLEFGELSEQIFNIELFLTVSFHDCNLISLNSEDFDSETQHFLEFSPSLE